eukprot:Seg1363.18 transcript_id=Seg1363.18/GoldUCD/mRNA.D3Y31 product="Glycoprotein 3-alpha-L-fucosyltransferase A" protein_id=Seg1363.18/GoldUCD/D3Y31
MLMIVAVAFLVMFGINCSQRFLRYHGLIYLIILTCGALRPGYLRNPKSFRKNYFDEWLRSNTHLKIPNALNFHERVRESKQVKTILIFTTLFGNEEWPNLKRNDEGNYLKRHGCPVSNCRLTINQDLEALKYSDIVVFHSRDMMDGATLRSLRDSDRRKGQIWVYFTSENPLNSQSDVLYDDLFDWTMTYKHNSDIWLPYARYYPHKPSKQIKRMNYAKTKSKLVAWLVSGCGNIRDRVVYELQQHLKLDVAGKCSSAFSNTFTCDTDKDCYAKIHQYKFYLAFENQYCDEYVTEKYWYKGIRNGVVPIVLGAGPYVDKRVAIPGSYIDALDFKTVADLAAYIKYLDANDTAYNEYFKWKEKYKLWEPICDWPFEPYWACEMCIRSNKGIKHQPTVKISEFWGLAKNCEGRIGKIQRFLEQSKHDFSKMVQNVKVAIDEPYVNPYDKTGEEIDVFETRQEQATETEVGLEASNGDYKPDKTGSFTDRSEASRSIRYEIESTDDYFILMVFTFSAVGFLFYLYRDYVR